MAGDEQEESERKARTVFVSQLLTEVYLEQMRNIERDESNPNQVAAEELELLKKAFRYNPNNANVLRGISRVALSEDSELATRAKAIYDPEDPRNHQNAPAMVFNELGSDALSKSNYGDSLKYFEKARRKAPNDPMILNNLAYTYLVCDDPNPERALKLIDEAIRFLPDDPKIRKNVRSNFYDTRGTALMQLNRLIEATAAFEIAIQDRPDNRKILESLVECYRANDLSPAVYLNRLKALDEQEAKNK